MKSIGIDKVLHFLVGALISFCVANVAALQEGMEIGNVWLGSVMGIAAAMMLEFIKEFVIDNVADWKDILATFLGSLLVLVANGIGTLFYYLSV